MHGAGAARGHAAAELRARHLQHVAQHPQQRHLRIDVRIGHGAQLPVDREVHGPILRESFPRGARLTVV
jgi:hypothetical protein